MKRRKNRMPTASVSIKTSPLASNPSLAVATAAAAAVEVVTTTTSTVPSQNANCEPLRLTYLKPSFNNHELALAARQDLWHKFIIFNVGEYSKETILDSVLLTCQPEVILALKYQVDSTKKATFLAKCTIAAIDTLVKQGLMIRLPDDNILKLDIVLGFVNNQKLPLNLHRIVVDVLNSRWDGSKKILNLENFHHDKQFGSLYCPLSSSSVLVFVFKCCKMRMEFKITELWLDGNPFCKQFKKPEDYIQAVKFVFPHIQRLDGVIIGVKQQLMPPYHPYFLNDESRISLVRQFIQHYFTLFDQKDRTDLNGIYESDAFFSATFGDIANPRHRQLTKIININRNLLKVVDYSRCYKYLLSGAGEIIDTLRRLPPMYHNYKNFTVDILHQGDNHLAVNIQGPFYYREFPISLYFSRTFILVEKDDREFRIVNDQYHIQSGNATMMENNQNNTGLNVIPNFIPTYLGEGEKNDLVKFLSNVSTMNMEYCREFLEQSDWNLRDAISKFMKSYTVNDISRKAFGSRR
ncbi:hypothetical protein KQX54_016773 [Cotesia glomerata]|uniref:Uncharacterized protein n=1 Tax=Cotesia glomerata TaxID=32391 RepID=A0AAV7ICJ8_COTGL|nr:hypothetical protein KQX54_016773 [Cotesia glomerata]